VVAPKKFDEEPRARAVRMYQERLRDRGESKLAARKAVGTLLEIDLATLRDWIEHGDRTEGAERPVVSEEL
jgi:transposase